MNVAIEKNFEGIVKIVIKYNEREFDFSDIDNFEQLVIDEANTSNKVSDKLLALEMLTRKMENKETSQANENQGVE